MPGYAKRGLPKWLCWLDEGTGLKRPEHGEAPQRLRSRGHPPPPQQVRVEHHITLLRESKLVRPMSGKGRNGWSLWNIYSCSPSWYVPCCSDEYGMRSNAKPGPCRRQANRTAPAPAVRSHAWPIRYEDMLHRFSANRTIPPGPCACRTYPRNLPALGGQRPVPAAPRNLPVPAARVAKAQGLRQPALCVRCWGQAGTRWPRQEMPVESNGK